MLSTRRIPALLFLFAGYFVAAKVGLSFASVHPSATAIWPATGIAIAGILLWGRDVWPAIFAAAFVANVTTAGSVATSIAIAVGNTLEGVLGAYFAERFANGRQAFERPPDIFRFVALTGLLSTAISPTIGATTLAVAGYASWDNYGLIWLTWWLGDVAGALLVTPIILLWRANPDVKWDRSQTIEGSLLLGGLLASTVAVFGGFYPPTRNYPVAFLCIPALVWTAFRFGQRETATAVLIVLGVATEGTLRGVGPFSDAAPYARLLIMQAFMATVAPMVLAVAALVTEQKRLLVGAERARADAEAANAAKDAFLAMLGHELRNPLAAITTAVHVLDRVATLEGKAVRVREIIVGQVAHLTRLVDDLLDVTRVTTGKIILRPLRVELSALVSQTLDTLAATGRSEGHAIEFSGEPAWIDGDATRLQQVVTNLVTNALKYTPAGGTIRVRVGTYGRVATIRVEDTGIGIAPELLPRIFDLFTQGLRGLDRSQGGLGIGLTIVKRLVELHGGSVDAASTPGRGTIFTVRLPAAPTRRADQQVVAGGRSRRPRRVLVVEDQPDVRDVLCLALSSDGHQTFEAADGPRAIEAASRSHPEVAVIDIGLPGCDGYEVARQIRKLPDGDSIYLIALTGYGQPEDRKLAEEAGFDVHIVKPVDPERLNSLVSDATRSSGDERHVSTLPR